METGGAQVQPRTPRSLEAAGLLAGIALGIAGALLVRVTRTADHRVITTARTAFAAPWVAAIGGRRTVQPEIAGRLVVSEATVKMHVNHLLAPTGWRDRAALVVYAYKTGRAR